MIQHIPWLKNKILQKEDVLSREDDLHKWSRVEVYKAYPDVQTLIRDSKYKTVFCDKTFAVHKVDVNLNNGKISFKSPLIGEEVLNNTVYGEYFQAPSGHAAVIVLGHWNSDKASYNRLARAYQKAGLSALRLSLPYHDERRPADQKIASGFLSSDINRTERSIIQAVCEVRSAVTWLSEKGYEKIGITGASLGSMIALLASCHDTRINAMVGYLLAADFPNVVWRGTATQHIRAGFGSDLSLQDLSDLWSCINPVNYLELLQRDNFFMHVGWARFDTVCPVDLTQKMLSDFKKLNIRHNSVAYSCGHNTLALSPFIQMAGLRGIYEMKKRLFL